MSAQPRVSIVVTNYNQADYIAQGIRSALAQDYPNLEVILADDCSTDNSASVIQPFMVDSRFRYHRNERNLKRVGNYHHAMYHLMTGDWGMIVDGDDFLLDPRFVSKAMSAATSHPSVVMVFGGCRMLTPDHRYRDVAETRDEWRLENGFEYFLRWGIWLGPPHQGTLYRRAAALPLAFYRYDILSADWECLRRLALRGDVLMHGRPVTVWRRHELGASNTMDVRQRIDDLKSITEPYADAMQLGFDRTRLEAWRKRTLVDYTLNNVRASILAGRMDCARDILAYMRTYDPQVHQACLRRIALDPKLGMMVMLLQLGGRRLANWPSDVWRQLTWRKAGENMLLNSTQGQIT